ncbi:hypothetical protein ACA910_020436 [Epithemia clementina (nom. ined.)]
MATNSTVSLAVVLTKAFSVLELLICGDTENTELDPTIGGKRSIFLDVDEPYTRTTIANAFRRHLDDFSVTLGPGSGMDAIILPSSCNFQWAEYERIDWESVLAGKHGASSYCVRKGISRKAQLAHYTHRHVCKHPKSILKSSIPKTVILDTWPVWEQGMPNTNRQGLADVVLENASSTAAGTNSNGLNQRAILEKCLVQARHAMDQAETEYMADVAKQDRNSSTTPPTWILKGSTVNKGAGIYLVHIYEQIVDICWSEDSIREWVLQRYIDPPLLLGGRKFHIRAYVLAVGALKVYFCRECLALCSGSQYNRNQKSGKDAPDFSNLLAHVTNTAYQNLDPNFSEESCILPWNKTTIEPLLPHGRYESGLVSNVIQQMEDITGELFRAFENEFGVFGPIPSCFEHYGLDFLVDKYGKVHLLEVNPGPDFKQTGTQLARIIERLMGSTIDVVFGGCKPAASNLSLVYDGLGESGRTGKAGSRGRSDIHMSLIQ